MKNRGRFQAQGNKLEKSESWAKEIPIYYCEGIKLINKLKAQLTSKQLQIRTKGFKSCEEFVERANKNGGIEGFTSKSFPCNYKERVDIEIHKGIAFKTKPQNGN